MIGVLGSAVGLTSGSHTDMPSPSSDEVRGQLLRPESGTSPFLSKIVV